jgi:SAM-dependent methyltransferase
MAKDWLQWHTEYADTNSSLSHRLGVVRSETRRALAQLVCPPGYEPRLISMCAGDGRDVIPVIAAEDRAGRRVRALLVEIDRHLAERARAASAAAGLGHVEVRTGDASLLDSYVGLAPAHVVLACGVFGNVSLDDARRTVAALPHLLRPGGVVIWTRGRPDDGTEPSSDIRAYFAEQGFTELSFTAPAEDRFRVGVHRLARRPVDPPPAPGARLFRFA